MTVKIKFNIMNEFLDDFDIEKESLEVAKSNIEELTAKEFKGGEMPVIIGPGFGAVIFHEACGHGLEATSVAPKLSIFTDLENKKVGTEKVTLIDDGTLNGEWGSNVIDDEGEKTEKNILIENGILTNYLIDRYSAIQMNNKSNGCGRRESYEYAPTSRMSNTYLSPGKDSFEDMLKSIKYGIYCKKLSGGQVNTTTGDFNFGVDAAYEIKNGKIGDRIKGVTLIGNGKDILNQVEMVGNDLMLGDGYCGSKSGMVPVTCGQPTIKISKILVGGKE
jgi:TldD protein